MEKTIVKVTAYGGKYAAAIGSGDKVTENGEINITGGNLEVYGGAFHPLFASDPDSHWGKGGAGIGGGIFGRADSIDISGGMVIASGGAMFGAEDMPAVATAIVQDIMRQINYEKDLFHR